MVNGENIQRNRKLLRIKYVNIYKQKTMYLCKLLIIVFCHTSFAILQFPYPKQTFELPNHPLNWICTVHITVATFTNYTTSDITERFLASNRGMIIHTVGVMLNRSIRIAPVSSFFEPCTISVFIDATVHGSSYVWQGRRLRSYFRGNEYAYRGWRHSLIILIYFSCYYQYNNINLHLPHRLFYHSLDCGNSNMFPNKAFVSGRQKKLRNITDPTHSIHDRQLPLAMRRRPKYGWDQDHYNIKPDHCLASRWDRLSQMTYCTMDIIAVHHYQHFLNFTTIAPGKSKDYGQLNTHPKIPLLQHSILFHAIDSINDRILYCDQNSDHQRLRPLSLSSPFSFETWVSLVFLLTLCAIASSFTIFDMRSVKKNSTTIICIKTIFYSLVELIMCLLEKDAGKKNCTKVFIGLIVICLGNTYKNYLTIELVFPRVQDAISNLTELLDLNFNVLFSVALTNVADDKSTWLNSFHYHLDIDETKREKYVREAERWLKLILYHKEIINTELASVTSKNAFMISGPYYIQLYNLKLINDRNYPLSCHFVKRPLAHKFREFYFFNPKAEEFKWLTAKFLDHGLFEFWKRLDSHMLSLDQRKILSEDRSKRSNSSSVEVPDVQNFIVQVHFIGFYIVIAILTAICVAIFLFECAIQNAQALSLFALKKFKHFRLRLLWTVVRSLFLMSRLIGRHCQNCKPF
jgi:hypothetical protein